MIKRNAPMILSALLIVMAMLVFFIFSFGCHKNRMLTELDTTETTRMSFVSKVNGVQSLSMIPGDTLDIIVSLQGLTNTEEESLRFYGAVITSSNDRVEFLDVQFKQRVDSEVDSTVPGEVLISAARVDKMMIGDLFSIIYLARDPGPVGFVLEHFQWNTGIPESVFVTGNKLTIEIEK